MGSYKNSTGYLDKAVSTWRDLVSRAVPQPKKAAQRSPRKLDSWAEFGNRKPQGQQSIRPSVAGKFTANPLSGMPAGLADWIASQSGGSSSGGSSGGLGGGGYSSGGVPEDPYAGIAAAARASLGQADTEYQGRLAALQASQKAAYGAAQVQSSTDQAAQAAQLNQAVGASNTDLANQGAQTAGTNQQGALAQAALASTSGAQNTLLQNMQTTEQSSFADRAISQAAYTQNQKGALEGALASLQAGGAAGGGGGGSGGGGGGYGGSGSSSGELSATDRMAAETASGNGQYDWLLNARDNYAGGAKGQTRVQKLTDRIMSGEKIGQVQASFMRNTKGKKNLGFSRRRIVNTFLKPAMERAYQLRTTQAKMDQANARLGQ